MNVNKRRERQEFRDMLRPVMDQLRTARQNRGWTQRDLATKLGLHQSSISDLENCYSTIEVSMLGLWSTLLGYNMVMTFTDGRITVTLTPGLDEQ